MASTPPSEFIHPGAVVFVFWADNNGPTKWARREVAKVGARQFTVHGVEEPGRATGAGGTRKLVQFRNREGSMSVPAGTLAHDAASEHLHITVVQDGTPFASKIIAAQRERLAVQRTERAAEEWRKVEARRTGQSYHDRRPSAAEVDEALQELAAAAVALREVLGVPGGE